MNFQAEEYLDSAGGLSIQHLIWSTADGHTLSLILQTKEMKKAIAILILHGEGLSGDFKNMDLTTSEGVAKAVRLQGVIEGIDTTLQRLMELAEEGNTGS